MSEINLQIEHHDDSKAILLFWLYLMTDLIMFAVLFAAYAALHGSIFGGPSGAELFDMPYVLAETLILLTSSWTCGMVMLSVYSNNKSKVIGWLFATFVLGASFLSLELYEFHKLISEGHGPQASAFLSSLFTLLATHGTHIAIGLLWLIILATFIHKKGLTPSITRKLKMFSLFWHFLDIVWIFIFTMVYLMAKI